jgi:L-alanine-DL-glutamate epimerase-like enolase superfamily enzyme
MVSDEGYTGVASTNCFGREVYEFTRDVASLLLGKELNDPEDLRSIWEDVRERAMKGRSRNMLGTVLRQALRDDPGRSVRWSTVAGNLIQEPVKIPLMRYRNISLAHESWFLNVALWDLLARSQDRSIAECLGKERDRIRAYASTGEVVSHETMDFVRDCQSRGFDSVKLRVKSPDPNFEEYEIVESVLDETPTDFAVGVDANVGWSLLPPYWSREDALRIGRFLEERGIAWLEEPLGCLDLQGITRLSQERDLEIVGGELEAGPEHQKKLLSVYDVVNPDVCMAVGFSDGRSLARTAYEQDTRITPHTWGLGPSLAAGLQFVCTLPECDRLEFPVDPSWPVEYRDAFLTEPLQVQEGDLHLPDRSGLGIRIDEDALESFTKTKIRLES